MLDIIVDGIAYGMVLFYIGQSGSILLLTDHTPTKRERNEEIRARYAPGETIGNFAGYSYIRSSAFLPSLEEGEVKRKRGDPRLKCV